MKANEATNALTLLKYTKSYADSVGKDQFFYVDTSTGTTEGRPAQALYNEGFAKRKILTDASAVNKISFNTFSIGANQRYFSKAQLEVNNSMHYPQLEMTSQEESRLYRALMSFNSGYNDFLSGPLIDRANFRNLFGMIYFDLRNQEEDVKDSVVSLTFRYELNGGNATGYTLNALVLHEREIELYTASGKLLIKA